MPFRRFLFLLPLTVLLHAQVIQPGTSIITTIAGDGVPGYSGDGGLAFNAELYNPVDVAVDSAGNVYIADTTNSRIRKVTPSTLRISSVAGNGTEGYSGDDGPATSASLSNPTGVAVDAVGNIYIADYGNSRIRKVTASTGKISTVAGNGTAAYFGDNGPATSAALSNPTGVAVDAVGNIYIADYANSRIRRVTASTGLITTIAGNGDFGGVGTLGDGGPATNAQFSADSVALDTAGNIYVADTQDSRIRKVTVATGLINTVAGNGIQGYSGDNGPATSAELWPAAVAVDTAGNIYIGGEDSRVRKVTVATGLITTFGGNGIRGYSGDEGPPTSAELGDPTGVALDSAGNVYIADLSNDRIRQVRASGPVSGVGVYRSSNGLWLENSQFNNVFTVADTVTLFAGFGLTPQPGDIPVVGDWSGTGTTKIGLYRPSTGTWFLDYNGNAVFDGPTIDRQDQYGGLAGDIPVVGDWTESGFSKIGIFRSGFLWLLDTNGNGVFDSGDQVFPFGGATGCVASLPGLYSMEPAGSCDIPVVGDWNRSGTTKVGVVRAAPGTSQPFLWILDTTGAQAFGPSSTVFAFGGIQGDVPVVGDWDGRGSVNIGVFRDGFFWVEDGTASMPTPPTATDILVAFPYGGIPGDIPVVGHW